MINAFLVRSFVTGKIQVHELMLAFGATTEGHLEMDFCWPRLPYLPHLCCLWAVEADEPTVSSRMELIKMHVLLSVH